MGIPVKSTSLSLVAMLESLPCQSSLKILQEQALTSPRSQTWTSECRMQALRLSTPRMVKALQLVHGLCGCSLRFSSLGWPRWRNPHGVRLREGRHGGHELLHLEGCLWQERCGESASNWQVE